MMLEEKIRGLAAKGELVHISLAYRDGLFWANFAAASPHGGYARASDKDPVIALEKAFAAAPIKIRAPKSRPEKELDPVLEEIQPEPEPEITAAVKKPHGMVMDEMDQEAAGYPIDAGFPSDWTKP